MVAVYVATLEELVSRSRLERYRPPSRDDLETATNYLWNVALSEALLQGLSAVEIGLRNSIHTVLSQDIGTEYWFWPFLAADEFDQFNRDWLRLRKNMGQRPSAGKVVANQSFGFWLKLFESRYDPIWSANALALLWKVFPYHPRIGVPPADWLTTSKIRTRVKLLVDLRNRAMHHEPVFQGIARPDEARPNQLTPVVALPDAHLAMTALLSWIHPDLAMSLRTVDRFPDVYSTGKADIEARLKAEIARVYGSL